MWLNINCLCDIYFNRNQQAFLAQMTSFAVRYDVIYHFFPINYKQLLDEVFVISGIIKVEVSVITLTKTLIIPDITKTESNNCFIILYLQVISQFLAWSMKRIEKPFLLRCLRT